MTHFEAGHARPQQLGQAVVTAPPRSGRIALAAIALLSLTLISQARAQTQPVLAAAVLPSSRIVQVGQNASFFASVVNLGTVTARGCSITPATQVPASFSFRPSDFATNLPSGAINQPVDIAAGAAQSFLFSFTPSAVFGPLEVSLSFACLNSDPARVLPNINTVLLAGEAEAAPDILALVATEHPDGVFELPSALGSNVFAAGALNLGLGANITVTADTGSASLPIDLSICQTDPTIGVCVTEAASSITKFVTTNEKATFAVFGSGRGEIAFDPALHRVSINFRDAAGTIRGRTSIAVRTAANADGRDLTLRPFSDNSPWNRGVPADAIYLPAPGIRNLFIGYTYGKDDHQNVGVAIARSSDPPRPVLYNHGAWNEVAAGNWQRFDNSRSVELEILAGSSTSFPFDANSYSTATELDGQRSLPESYFGKGNPPTILTVAAPLSARPAPDNDGHMVVFLPDGRALETYATIILSSGEIVAQMASFTDYRADGTGWWNGRRASMLPSYGGILRDREVSQEVIDHALAANVSRTVLDTAAAWPALAFDANPRYSGSLPMGSLLAIPRDIDVADFEWQSALGLALARAAQAHGIYLVDRGGSDGISLITETTIRHPLMVRGDQSLQLDLNRIRDLLMWVPNNRP